VQAKEHLTAHELELLSRKALDHRLARIRDVFVFCCLTGLAFADADHLRREHLSQDDEGRWWIHKPREKTSVMSRIPLLPATLEILRRYEHDEVCVARSRVLPTPSNQKMNAYLKEIAAVCGINKVLTTHVARHTFACMAVEYGMPIDVLAKILGQHDAPLRQVLRDSHRPRNGDVRTKTDIGRRGVTFRVLREQVYVSGAPKPLQIHPAGLKWI